MIQNKDVKEFPAVRQIEHSKRIEFEGAVYYIFESILNSFSEKLEQCNCSIDIFLSELSKMGCGCFLFLLEIENTKACNIVAVCFNIDKAKLGYEYWIKVIIDLMKLESDVKQ